MRDILLSKETCYMKDYDFSNLKQNMHFDIENRSPYIQMTEALNNSRMNGDYENTIGENKEESISQAIDIALREMRSAEQSMREHIYRPEVNLKKGIWLAVLMIAVMVVWIIFSKRLTFYVPLKRYQIILALVVIYISLVSIFAKSIVIWIVKVYQRYAPAKVRLSCRFEPTCSQYMLVAIDKYGIVKGVVKGIRRLLRCHPPNGGEDYP